MANIGLHVGFFDPHVAEFPIIREPANPDQIDKIQIEKRMTYADSMATPHH